MERKESYLSFREVEAEIQLCKSDRFKVECPCYIYLNLQSGPQSIACKQVWGGRSGLNFRIDFNFLSKIAVMKDFALAKLHQRSF